MRKYFEHILAILLTTETWEVWEKLELLWETTRALNALEQFFGQMRLEKSERNFYFGRTWAIWEKLKLLRETTFDTFVNFYGNLKLKKKNLREFEIS